MAFFKKPILSNKRKKALDAFLVHAVQALKELEKEARNPLVKSLFEAMAENVARTPIYFYPSKVLRANFYSHGGRLSVSVTKGENVSIFKIIQIGGRHIIKRESFINLPAAHVFKGEKMTLDGILTLCHEYAHFPKPKILEFAKIHSMSVTQAEELFADVLSAKLAVKMGFPKNEVIRHFSGREIVYGKIPYREFILRAIG